ncbi:hypothetical protein BCR43DRAFT_497051 [Syncephalastrum racemosum]|uniref:BZIP domain-containing protein n=1 Tax=Syncephalastrum racemosum TaxID=13706 RepID=A0A1X2H540_SYNRA|nr:hypothetical protein BCR43DRAFT_497051 [Syncephalastrum racemosum]
MAQPPTQTVKPDPAAQEEQDDLLMSYLNADCLDTTSTTPWSPSDQPLSPPYSTDGKPATNDPLEMTLVDDQTLDVNTLLHEFPQWMQQQQQQHPGHPQLHPQYPIMAPDLFLNFPMQAAFLQPLPLPTHTGHALSPGTCSAASFSSSSSSSAASNSGSDSEQPKKKRGRKKREPHQSSAASLQHNPQHAIPPTLLPRILPAEVKTEPTQSNNNNNSTHVSSSSSSSSFSSPPSSSSSTTNSPSCSSISSPKTSISDRQQQHQQARPSPPAIKREDSNPNPMLPSEDQQKVSALAKRQERLIKNRAAALLSRKRKREHLTALEEDKRNLTEENEQLKTRVAALESQVGQLQKENHDLWRRVNSQAEPDSHSHSRTLSTTTKNATTKATGMVFMIILFSFALFSLPGSTITRLTVGGAPKPLALAGAGAGAAQRSFARDSGEFVRPTLDSGVPVRSKSAESTTDLVLIDPVRPLALRSWIEGKLNNTHETGLVRWSSSSSSSSLSGQQLHDENNNNDNVNNKPSQIYLYAPEFSQVAPFNTTMSTTMGGGGEFHNPILSLISPLSSNAVPTNDTAQNDAQEYLQIDVQVLGSRVIDGQLMALNQCPHATSLLDRLKDDLVGSPPPACQTPPIIAREPVGNERRLNKDMRRKMVGEDRARKIARVVM